MGVEISTVMDVRARWKMLKTPRTFCLVLDGRVRSESPFSLLGFYFRVAFSIGAPKLIAHWLLNPGKDNFLDKIQTFEHCDRNYLHENIRRRE